MIDALRLTRPDRLELGQGVRHADGRLVLVDLLAGRLLMVLDDPAAPLQTLAELPVPLAVVEPVGAGDAFAAGFLAGLLHGVTTKRALRLGHLTAVSALKVTGDHGPLPDATERERLLGLPDDEWSALATG
ncbi:hypothetical protein GCM10010297_22430 [Streptomyces malachitofuscus]|nr:hypothetical protein GCM10010297_22430 [Streptomyces malachitofuscus]